ncbi:MAG: DMT family transporter [Arenicellales bacterium]|jgi:drug/metabolite transporter (DMT)-like permease|nr:DMT family transporter [Arenicellales bacterium]|tara:strand:+ start:3533 stop:4447 length:915 start_codon:yes stop_codon:yes gene_type:complete
MNTPTQKSPLFNAIAIILLAIFLFDVMGAIIKHLGTRYPAQQLSMLRNVFGLIPSVLVLFYSSSWHEAGRPVRLVQWKLAIARGGFVAIAQFCFYLSLIHMEFATASTIAFSGALFVTLLSIPILGHRVGMWRWSAVGMGFVGIVLVMRPDTDGFNVYALLPACAALGYAASSVTAQLFDKSVPTALINLYALAGALTGAVLLVVFTGGYVEVATYQDWLWLLAMGVAGGSAVFCLVTAYRLTAPSNLAPFEYFSIPFAFLLGWMFFDEAPFHRLIPGVFLIIGGGLLIVWRERKVKTEDPLYD